MTVKEKLTNEMQQFRATYETMTPAQVYNDWYIIGFYEAYYEMLSCDFVDWDDYDYIAKWLCEFECPINFLYSEWLGVDGAFNHDWDVMFDFIEETYWDCINNKH